MSKKLQCQQCGKAEYDEDLYNYDGKILCRYCIVARVCEGNISCEYVGTCNDKKYSNKKLQSQLDQQKAMWNELKEWVSFTQPKNINDEFISGVCSAYSNVIDKMQELEKGEKDVED